MTIIGPDVSFWQDDNATPQRIDFAKMKAAGARFVFIRVGQNEWVDPDFAYNWSEAKRQGFKRGAYWYLDSRKDPIFQADLFVDTVGADKPEMFYVFDLEETYGGPFAGFPNWKKHIDRLEARVGTDMLMGYSRASYIDEHNLSSDAIAYLRRFLWWMAHYGVSIPALPRGWTSNEYVFHQYTETGDGRLYGAESSRIDLNRFNGDEAKFAAMFGGVTQPPVVDEIYHTHPGVTVHKLIRFGCPVFVHVIDPKIAKVWVTGLDNKFKTVAQTATRYSAAVVTNGGGWPYNDPTWTNEIWKSKGVLLKAIAKDNRPWVGITRDGEVVFGQGVPSSDVLDVVGYDRYLGIDGVFNSRYLSDTVKDARTFSGRSRSGKFVLCVAEGDDYDKYGLTFKEEWDILAEFDCDTGGNHDGGSSSGVVNKALGDGSLTKPSDPQLAYVINSIVVNAGSEGATITYLPKPEIWRLRNVEDWQGEDQPDTDQAGAGFSPTIAGTSGVSNWKQIGSPEMALIQRLNTGIDSFTWDRKKQWAIKDVAGWMYQSTTSNIDLPPWYDWNLIMGSRKPYGSQWNLVRVLARASNGFVMIDAIPKADNYDNIQPDDIRIHRVNVTTNGVSRDTPVGIFNRPIFSPVGFKRAVGDLIGTGVWIPTSYLYQKMEEVTVGEFDIKVTGVPKYYLGILTGYNNLNIRYEPNFGDAGENNTVAFAYRNSVWTADQEVINPNGDIWWRINKHGLWLCAYQASKGARGRYAVKV